jgi:hypothetical protein
VLFTSLMTIVPSVGVTLAAGSGNRGGASWGVVGFPLVLGVSAGVGWLTGFPFAGGVVGWETGFPWGGGPPAREMLARQTSKPVLAAASKLNFLKG